MSYQILHMSMSVMIPDGSHWWGIDAKPSPLKVVWSLILATTPSLLLVLPIKASSFRQPVSRKEADILWSASKPQYTVRDVRYFLNWTFLPSLALSYYCDHPLTFCWLYLIIIIIIIKFWPPISFFYHILSSSSYFDHWPFFGHILLPTSACSGAFFPRAAKLNVTCRQKLKCSNIQC